MVMPHIQTGVGQIVSDFIDAWDVKMPYGTELWSKKHCEIYNTKKQAQAAYDKFTQTKIIMLLRDVHD